MEGHRGQRPDNGCHKAIVHIIYDVLYSPESSGSTATVHNHGPRINDVGFVYDTPDGQVLDRLLEKTRNEVGLVNFGREGVNKRPLMIYVQYHSYVFFDLPEGSHSRCMWDSIPPMAGEYEQSRNNL